MSNYDYWATHSFLHSRQFDEKVVIDYLLGNQNNPYGQEIPDLSARVGLSALALVGDKEYARTGTRREAGGLANLYQKEYVQAYLPERKEQCFALLNQAPDLSLLPVGSFALQFAFRLTRPYISKDDVALHLLDNPVKKEWVFKLPYVAATQWKGSLRHALWQMGHKEEESDLIQRLFGTANDNDGTGNQGRLYFYPTFFDQLGLEVINPHERATGAGSKPILMECVPSGATGMFTLLYTPLDRIGQDEDKTRQQVFDDLQLVAQGVQAMLTLYGFGAKTSSGFGLADDKLPRQGQLKVSYPTVAEPIEQDFNSLSLLKRKSEALKRLMDKEQKQ